MPLAPIEAVLGDLKSSAGIEFHQSPFDQSGGLIHLRACHGHALRSTRPKERLFDCVDRVLTIHYSHSTRDLQPLVDREVPRALTGQKEPFVA
jgi:hypothetical protein